MTPSQLRIKKLAEIFAIFLTVAIFSGISGIVLAITGGISLKNNYLSENTEGVRYDLTSPTEFEIEIEAASLKIITDDSFYVITSDGSANVKEKNGKVRIEENGLPFSSFDSSEIVIALPEGYNAQKFELTTGAGIVHIEKLSCDRLSLEVGAGEASADYLRVNTSADIEVGTGKIAVDNSDMNNLSFEVGVGEGRIKGVFNSKTEAEVGIGELTLIASPSIESYTVEVQKGIGRFVVDGERINKNSTIGNGENIIKASGGIGSVEIGFEQ